MIQDLMELNDFVVSFCNKVVHQACEGTTSGQYYVNIQEILDANKWGYDDFLEYRDLIFNELASREELIDFDYNESDFELDVNCGLDYCPHYQWCEGDEEIFECSYDEWLEKPTKPIADRPTYSQLLDDLSVRPSVSPMYFYVGDGVYIDKDYSSLDEALQAFDYLAAKDRVCLGVVNQGKATVLLDNVYDSFHLNKDALKNLEPELVDKLNSFIEQKYPANDLLVGKWRVHVVAPGDTYGRNNCLTYEDKPSCIEFYDMSQDKTKFPEGQFVSSYFIETLLEDKWGTGPEQLMRGGLSLYADIPSWSVAGDEMKRVYDWLKNHPLLHNEKYLHCSGTINVLTNIAADEYIACGVIFDKLSALPHIRNLSVEHTSAYIGADGPGNGFSYSFDSQANSDAINKVLTKALWLLPYKLNCEERTVVNEKAPLDQVIDTCSRMSKVEDGRDKGRDLNKDER